MAEGEAARGIAVLLLVGIALKKVCSTLKRGFMVVCAPLLDSFRAVEQIGATRGHGPCSA